MGRSLNVRRPTTSEVRRASAILSQSDHRQVRRRADVIVLLSAGLSAQDIATSLGVHPNTIYNDLRQFARHRITALGQARRRGAPVRLTDEQCQSICRIADQAPYELGLPNGRWSLTRLRAHLIKQRIVKRISREHLRQVLKKGGSNCTEFAANSTAVTRSARQSLAA